MSVVPYKEFIRAFVATVGSALFLAGGAWADTRDDVAGASLAADSAAGSDATLAPVIVEAERRANPVQTTPVAVGVLGADALDANGVKKLWDANGLVGGLYLSSYPSNMQYVAIRGIGTSDPGTFSAVGYYIDDVYLGRTFGRGAIDFPDIERIEVLRGPQGTLYGQNTTGGAIKFVSKDPALSGTDSWASASAGNIGQSESHAYFSAAIVPGVFSASLAYSHRANTGDTYNAFTHREDDRLNVDQARAKFRWKPSGRWDIGLALDATRDASDNFIPSPNNGPAPPQPRVEYANTNPQMSRSDAGETLKINYKIDENLTVKSITANRHDTTDPHPWDTDGLPTDLFGWTQHFVEKVHSQELQLGGNYEHANFTAGTNFYDEHFDFDRLQWLNLSYTDLESHLSYRNWAVYGQGHYSITPALGVTAGLRFNDENHGFSAASYHSDVLRDRLSRNYVVNGLTQRNSATTPKIGVDYQVAPDIFSYASFTRGEKSGGFNRAAGTLSVASVPVSPEKVTAYEAGIKTQWLEHRVTANIAVFYNNFKDYQAGVTNPVINGQQVNGNVVVNAGSAHTDGIEFEGAWKLTRALEWHLTFSTLSTAFDNFINPTGAANANYAGNQVPNAPHLLGSTQATYLLPLASVPGSVRINGLLSYIEGNYTDIANTTAFRADSQVYANGGIDYASEDGHWNLGLSVKNAFNRDYALAHSINAALGTNTTSYNPPRTWLATIRYQFN